MSLFEATLSALLACSLTLNIWLGAKLAEEKENTAYLKCLVRCLRSELGDLARRGYIR